MSRFLTAVARRVAKPNSTFRGRVGEPVRKRRRELGLPPPRTTPTHPRRKAPVPRPARQPNPQKGEQTIRDFWQEQRYLQKLHDFMSSELFPPLIDEAGNVNHDATPYWSPIDWGLIAEIWATTQNPVDIPEVPAHWDHGAWENYQTCTSGTSGPGPMIWHDGNGSANSACLGNQSRGTPPFRYSFAERRASNPNAATVGMWWATSFGTLNRFQHRMSWRKKNSQVELPYPEFKPYQAPVRIPGRVQPVPVRIAPQTPNIIARPMPDPIRVPNAPRPYQTPSVNTSTSARNVQRTKTPHNRVPPGKGEKEKKTRATPAAFSRVGKFLSTVTEGADIIEAVYNALPEKIRQREFAKKGNGRKLTPQEQLAAIYKNMRHVDMITVVANLGMNHIEDKIIGTIGKKIASKHQAWLGNRPVGFQTGGQGRSTPGIQITPL